MSKNRFLAIIAQQGAPPDEFGKVGAAMRERRFTEIFKRGPLWVFAHEDAAATILEDERGVLLGEVFPQGRVGLAKEPSSHAAHSGTNTLRCLWGGFTAFFLERDGGVVDVARDPSGVGPCLFASVGDAAWFFSDMEIAIAAGLAAPAIDWNALAQYLVCPHQRGRRTCLSGVDQLLPGMTARIANGRVQAPRCLWTPWDHAKASARIRKYDDAVEALRTATTACIGAWASRSGRILLELSGGLDSSIIAACLAGHGADFSCVTFAGEDPASDEREHARRIASRLGVNLRALKLDGAKARFYPRGSVSSAFPNATPWGAVIDDAVAGAVNEVQSDSVFSGGGGDNVFCYLTTAAPAADALRAKGAGPQFFTAVGDVAALHQASVWRAARYAIRKAFFARPLLWPRSAIFLSADAATCVLDPHPWFEETPADAPPGKIEQVASIACAVSVSDGSERALGAPLSYPLLSRPMIETCLSIPTWMWVTGGRNRAVARDAFAEELPVETLTRRTKGDLTGLVSEIYRKNKNEIAGLLMDGRLARERIIDREAVSARLRSSEPFRDASFTRLVMLASVEGWIQSRAG